MLPSGPVPRTRGLKGITEAIDSGQLPPMDDRTKKLAPLVLMGAGVAMFFVLTVLACIISFVAVKTIPLPGMYDHWEDLTWARQGDMPWNISHGKHVLHLPVNQETLVHLYKCPPETASVIIRLYHKVNIETRRIP